MEIIEIANDLESTVNLLAFKCSSKEQSKSLLDLSLNKLSILVEGRIGDFGEELNLVKHPKEFVAALSNSTLPEGYILGNAITNERDMIEGCINRLCVTDDAKEFSDIHKSLLQHLRRLHDLVCLRCGDC